MRSWSFTFKTPVKYITVCKWNLFITITCMCSTLGTVIHSFWSIYKAFTTVITQHVRLCDEFGWILWRSLTYWNNLLREFMHMGLVSLVTRLAKTIIIALHTIEAILATLNRFIAVITSIPGFIALTLMLNSFLFSLSFFQRWSQFSLIMLLGCFLFLLSTLFDAGKMFVFYHHIFVNILVFHEHYI